MAVKIAVLYKTFIFMSCVSEGKWMKIFCKRNKDIPSALVAKSSGTVATDVCT